MQASTCKIRSSLPGNVINCNFNARRTLGKHAQIPANGVSSFVAQKHTYLDASERICCRKEKSWPGASAVFAANPTVLMMPL
jgi:hypothetical protein